MSKKCISMIIMFAFLHYLVAGCAKTTMVQQDRLSVESAECCVYEVILTTGEKYEFEAPGGRYHVVPHLLTGTLNDGRKFSLDLADENIKEIRISTGQKISKVDLAENFDQAISEIAVGGNIYTFNQSGGRLKAEAKTIRGIVKSGDEIDVPIEDILHVEVKRVAAGRTAGLVGTVLIVLGAVVIGILATTAPMGNAKFGN